MEEVDMRCVRRDDIEAPFRGELGELIYEMIGRPEPLGGTTRHSFVHVVIPPGRSSSAHFHKLSEETYYGLLGRGRVEIDDVRRWLQPHDACLIVPGEVHQIFNDGTVDLEFLAVSAPAWVPEDTYPVDRTRTGNEHR
jgi:mannose-6-phosphate isomerase-like protein (cupin superfamily)